MSGRALRRSRRAALLLLLLALLAVHGALAPALAGGVPTDSEDADSPAISAGRPQGNSTTTTTTTASNHTDSHGNSNNNHTGNGGNSTTAPGTRADRQLGLRPLDARMPVDVVKNIPSPRAVEHLRSLRLTQDPCLLRVYTRLRQTCQHIADDPDLQGTLALGWFDCQRVRLGQAPIACTYGLHDALDQGPDDHAEAEAELPAAGAPARRLPGADRAAGQDAPAAALPLARDASLEQCLQRLEDRHDHTAYHLYTLQVSDVCKSLEADSWQLRASSAASMLAEAVEQLGHGLFAMDTFAEDILLRIKRREDLVEEAFSAHDRLLSSSRNRLRDIETSAGAVVDSVSSLQEQLQQVRGALAGRAAPARRLLAVAHILPVYVLLWQGEKLLGALAQQVLLPLVPGWAAGPAAPGAGLAGFGPLLGLLALLDLALVCLRPEGPGPGSAPGAGPAIWLLAQVAQHPGLGLVGRLVAGLLPAAGGSGAGPDPAAEFLPLEMAGALPGLLVPMLSDVTLPRAAFLALWTGRLAEGLWRVARRLAPGGSAGHPSTRTGQPRRMATARMPPGLFTSADPSLSVHPIVYSPSLDGYQCVMDLDQQQQQQQQQWAAAAAEGHTAPGGDYHRLDAEEEEQAAAAAAAQARQEAARRRSWFAPAIRRGSIAPGLGADGPLRSQSDGRLYRSPGRDHPKTVEFEPRRAASMCLSDVDTMPQAAGLARADDNHPPAMASGRAQALLVDLVSRLRGGAADRTAPKAVIYSSYCVGGGRAADPMAADSHSKGFHSAPPPPPYHQDFEGLLASEGLFQQRTDPPPGYHSDGAGGLVAT
ncbi:hypothetical protein H696_05641 [Fonticula alba]|uniref:Uncharacterized protein n=1 Tax=Fonticula alba TaxID=691883 RepID=A0A058Z1V5_FONAL|nr:hypothetical protein H696_05641 [Fonticula alba]KCV67913.1 hypothetical protein H696_05641 [Fonticula alba]|eukprot:XP_009497733.1 hypothetical protein H696_05641 [Fonticula alba]